LLYLSVLPYQFDVVNYYSISNNDLKAHIDRAGIVSSQFFRTGYICSKKAGTPADSCFSFPFSFDLSKLGFF